MTASPTTSPACRTSRRSRFSQLCNGTSGPGRFPGHAAGSVAREPRARLGCARADELRARLLEAHPAGHPVPRVRHRLRAARPGAAARDLQERRPAARTSTSSTRSTSRAPRCPGPRPAAPSRSEPVLNGYHSLPGAGRGDELHRAARHHDALLERRLHRLGRHLDDHRPRAVRAGAGLRGARPRGSARSLGEPRCRSAPTVHRGCRPPAARTSRDRSIGQHGWIPGYLTSVYSDPGTGMTVAVVLNNSAAGSGARGVPRLGARRHRVEGARGEPARQPRQFGLPWTAEQYHEAITQAAVCPLPAP